MLQDGEIVIGHPSPPATPWVQQASITLYLLRFYSSRLWFLHFDLPQRIRRSLGRGQTQAPQSLSQVLVNACGFRITRGPFEPPAQSIDEVPRGVSTDTSRSCCSLPPLPLPPAGSAAAEDGDDATATADATNATAAAAAEDGDDATATAAAAAAAEDGDDATDATAAADEDIAPGRGRDTGEGGGVRGGRGGRAITHRGGPGARRAPPGPLRRPKCSYYFLDPNPSMKGEV